MINHKEDILLVLVALLFVFSGCVKQNKNSETNNIQPILDSLKSIHAPDSRVALWNISVNEDKDVTIVVGELDNIIAKNAIIKAIGKELPEVKTDLVVLPGSGDEQLVTGLINNSVANLRSNPRHSAEIATQALLGTPIRVLKQDGDWLLVQTPNKYLAWVDSPALVSINKEELDWYKDAEKIIYNEQYGFSYSEPNDKSQTVSDLVVGCILPVISSNKKYYKVQYPDNRVAWVKKGEVVDANSVFFKEPIAENLIITAKKFLGIPYLWGGTSSKSIDCSGFTSTVFFMNGIVLQRDASQQTKYGKEITTEYEYHNLLPGDLLFYGRKASDSLKERVTHVAIYMNDSEFIHASGKVRINSIDSTRNNFISRYPKKFVRTVRVIGEVDGTGIEEIYKNKFYKEIISTKK